MKRLTLSFLLLVAVALSACGDREKAPPQDRREPAAAPAKLTPSEPTPAGVRQIDIRISGAEYLPPTVTVKQGEKVRLVFFRDEKPTCGEAVVFPSLDIRRDVPLNGTAFVDLQPQQKGEIAFTCVMNMMRGKVIVQ